MSAGCRCGQKAEALDCYQQIRQRLDEDLGVIPGTQLQHVHQQVLRQDPALTSPANFTQRALRPVPAQLPHDVAGFTGREEELTELRPLLAPEDDQSARQPMVTPVIRGTAGIGRTALPVPFTLQVARTSPNP